MCKFDISSPDSAVSAALARLQAALATPQLRNALYEYFDACSTFAGHTFDSLGDNPPDRITSDDLFAVTLLDLSWSPSTVRWLLGGLAQQVSTLLGSIDGSTTMWDSARGCQELVKAETLWGLLNGIPGVGPTRIGKLMARKRPLLVPIADSVVISAVGTSGSTWRTLRYCFQQQSFQQAVESVRPSNAADASLLRIFDVAIWMLCSNSQGVRQVRNRAGIPHGSCHCSG